MTYTRSSNLVTFILIVGIIWPIVVNAQIGNTFIFLGVDWKADNLDGTIFWLSLILYLMQGMLFAIGEWKKDREDKRRYGDSK